jgi:TP901 family phage tail tape measure protein
VRTVGVKLTADVSSYMANMRRAQVATKDFAGDLNKAAATGKLDHVADRAGVMGIALAGAFGYAVKSAADFDKAMSAVSAATHANARDMGLLREAALQAGKDTQYSATQAAQGITELSKAGVSTASILGGGLKGALALAAAGQLDVGEAAEIAASAMTQFRLSGDKVPHVADLLAAGAGKAQGSVHDMGMALNQSGLVAAQFGLSIEDTTGVLAEFANAGLIGSDAGTSLKTMLLALSNPSQRTKDEMDKLGISFYDATGKFIGLSGVAQVLQTRLGGLTDAQRQQALGQIFGNDAIRSASILYADGAKGVETWKNKVNDAGYASETAARLTDNLAGDLERLKSSVETLAIESGSGANGGLRVLVKAVGSLVDGFSSLPAPVSGAITVLTGVSGAALLLGAGWIKLRKTTAEMRTELEALGPTGERAAAGMSRVGAAAGKVAGVFAALQVAGAVIGHFQDALNPQIDALTIGLQRYAATGKAAGEMSRVLGGGVEKLQGQFQILADTAGKQTWARNIESGLESIIPGLKGTDKSLASTRERINAIDASLAGLTTSGNSAEANAIFQKLASVLATGGVSMAEFRKQFPQYTAALETAGAAAKGTAGKTGDLSSALNSRQGRAEGVQDRGRGGCGRRPRRAGRDGGAVVGAEGADRPGVRAAGRREKSHRGAEERHQGGQGTRAQQQRGPRRHPQAGAGRARPAGQGRGADGHLRRPDDPGHVFDAARGGPDQEADQRRRRAVPGCQEKRRQVRRHLQGERVRPGAVNAKKQLDVAYTAANKFAGPYQARVSVSGDAAAKSKLAKLLIQQDALKKGIPISAAAAAYRKNASGFSRGGWTGPGSKYQEAGVVHADEFVIKKESRRKIEAKAPGMLNEMNATGQLPGYDAGGLVTWPFPATAAMTRIPSKAEVMSAVAGAIGGSFGKWPSSPGAQRGDSGVWRKIVALVNASGIPHHFGNGYRPGDPLWHGSGRAVDWMGYNQDRLAQFFLARQGQVLELIHRSKTRDYGITRGHYHAMPHQWPLHRNHLHIAMKAGGIINEPITGVGESGRTYSFGENYQPERVVPNWQPGAGGGSPAGSVTTINVTVEAPVGSHPREIGRQVVDTIGAYLQSGGELRIQGQKVF